MSASATHPPTDSSRASRHYARELRFTLNGQPVRLRDVSPAKLLIDFLRHPDIGLTGTKKVCAQGGCGACTVMLSRYDARTKQNVHAAINSCLHPLCAIDGMALTTIEGTGGVKTALSPVQFRVGKENATQCGYCTPGWVMNMHSLLAAKGDRPCSQLEIERTFDGNLCRCTGYRPLLYAMKHFAADWSHRDVTMTCDVDPTAMAPVTPTIAVPPADAVRRRVRAVYFSDGKREWYRPVTLRDVYRLRHAPRARLVAGNTSFGIYPAEVEAARRHIDLTQVPELREVRLGVATLRLGGAVTYNEAIAAIDSALERFRRAAPEKCAGLEALRYLAGRTAGHIVRNAATLAGNTMLVVQHQRTGTPFPSDLFTALATLDATVLLGRERWPAPRRMALLEFASAWLRDRALREEAVIVAYEVPHTRTGEFAETYKTARREVNAHAIVNGGFRVRFDEARTVNDAAVVLGGIGPIAFRARRTERFLRGRRWDAATLAGALASLDREIRERLARCRARMRTVPAEGFAEEYLVGLGVAYLYKFFVKVALAISPGLVPPAVQDAGKRWLRPLSHGTQRFARYPEEYPVNQPFVKQSAFLQSSGAAIYTHDVPAGARGLHCAPVLSRCASARFFHRLPRSRRRVPPARVLAQLRRKFPAVIDYLTWQDVPGKNVLGSGGDDPIFARDNVTSYGQCLGLIVANDEASAAAAADFVAQACIGYTARRRPLLSIDEALAAYPPAIFADRPATASYQTHIWKVTRPGSNFSWRQAGATARLEGTLCRVVRGTQRGGGQIHFYFETQCCVAERGERNEVTLQPSSQMPDFIQDGVAQALGVQRNEVVVRMKPLGGGYGGKCSRSLFAALPAALAAWKHSRPARMVLRREADSEMFGHRHPVRGDFEIAIATGEDAPGRRGRILGRFTQFWLDGGSSYDCSFAVADAAQLGADGAYRVPHYGSAGDVCRTNLSSNTAMRSFGMIQSMLVQEEALEAASHAIGMLPEDVRALNFYAAGDLTPYGQRLDDCDLRQVWDHVEKRSRFCERLAAAEAFNAGHRWRKRGLSMIPLKYPVGFNLPALEQAGALVEVYDQDGTVLVRHGGVEMGQGLMTKIMQIAAMALNVPLGLIRVLETDTSVVPNPIGTGASTGTPFNGTAVLEACTVLRRRLEDYGHKLLAEHGADWCRQQGVNFWDYAAGWRATAEDPLLGTSIIWTKLVALAERDRVNLSAQIRTPIRGGTTPIDPATLEFKGAPAAMFQFTDFAYAAACSEVEIDVLTGETTILRADVTYDLGRSLNPAVDIGQVEGGFIQGVGCLLMEELVYEPEGPDAGRLNTSNTWGYKVPAASTIPLEMHVDLFPHDAEAPGPRNRNLLLSSKAVGEPPTTLAISVFFAIKHAILAARRDRGHDEWFSLASPATVQRVREACAVQTTDLHW